MSEENRGQQTGFEHSGANGGDITEGTQKGATDSIAESLAEKADAEARRLREAEQRAADASTRQQNRPEGE